jgi:hypothetical protein
LRPILAGMAKKPEPPKPPEMTWTIYKFASRLLWVGIVLVTDEREAIET